MAGYSTTPLWKKLGYKAEMEAVIDGAPTRYAVMLHLPPEIKIHWLPKPRAGWGSFTRSGRTRRFLKKKLAGLRKLIAPDGVIWISWPKKSSGVKTDITEDLVRTCALPLGLVDVKVCAIDEVWSGLKLMIRRAKR